MTIHRPWKSSSSSKSLNFNDGNSAFVAAGQSNNNKQLSKRNLFQILIAVIIGGSLLSWQQEEQYGASTADPTKNRNNAAICAIQKGGLRYLDEWVQYHLLAMGFDDIFLYDNSDDFELEAWYQSYSATDQKLQKRIHIQHYPGLRRQNGAYTHCIRQIQRAHYSHAWIAFIDMDEFVVLRDTQRYPYISDFLQSLPPDYGGLAVNWVVFQLNGHMNYENLPVTLRFQNRTENAVNPHIKTIARTQYLRCALNPHYVGYLLFRWWIHTYDSRGNIVEGAFNPELADDEIAIYHYNSKSLEEYKERCTRGRADVSRAESNKQLACRSDGAILKGLARIPELTKDDSPWQLLKERVPSYANKYIHA